MKKYFIRGDATKEQFSAWVEHVLDEMEKDGVVFGPDDKPKHDRKKAEAKITEKQSKK